MSRLLPWLEDDTPPFMNIETLDREHIPDEPGVYIMISDHTEYIYPWSVNRGSSRVYYIGKSINLRKRLMTHKRYCVEAISKPPYEYYYPRYEYAAHHGCNVTWVISENPEATEREMLIKFAKYYGAKPVANGQSGWESEEE